MEDVMTAIESVYERLRAEQEANAKLQQLVADYKELYEDMKSHRDECFKLANESIRELDAMRSRIKDALEGGEA